MERGLFQSKLSFAVFVWLAVFINATVSYTTHQTTMWMSSFSNTVGRILSIPTYANIKEATSEMSTAIFKSTPTRTIPSDDLQCMAENIYYEAATQSYAGKIAVGQVVLNRISAPGYPNTVCKVIYEGSQNIHTSTCQFSWVCSSHAEIVKTSVGWQQSVKAAKELLGRKESMIDITEGATSYHANYVKPSWSKQLRFVTQIDQHLFYR